MNDHDTPEQLDLDTELSVETLTFDEWIATLPERPFDTSDGDD